MKNSKYYIALGFIALCAFSFVPLAFAAAHRPLDDWFYDVNGDPLNDWIMGWGNIDFSLYPLFDRFFEFTPVWDCDYNGYVLDKENNDGNHRVTVYIQLRNIPFMLLKDQYGWIMDGIMDCTFKMKFLINTEMWTNILMMYGIDDDGFDDDGHILLPALDAIRVDGRYGVYLQSVHVEGHGTGEFFTDWDDYQVGDTAKVKVNQVGLLKPDGAMYWPCEITFVH